MIIAAIVIICMLWLLSRRFQEKFIRAYGLFFLVLLFFVINKGEGNRFDELGSGAFSPLSLLRWGLLGVLLWVSLRTPRPEGYRSDITLGALGVLLLTDIIISTVYADDFSYSFMRAISFILLSIATLIGVVRHLYWRVNCVKFFRLHYYVAWCVLFPAMLFHLAGLHRFGVSIIMGQYAGPFGNQNLFGIFTALITPYVLFHWRIECKRKRDWWMDITLLAVIFFGLWLSNSRGGMLAWLIAVTSYFFVINMESRLKIVVAAICLAVSFVVFADLQKSVMRFIRKDTIERAELKTISSQLYEERRYDLWSNVLPLYWEKKLTGYGFAMSHLLTFPFSGDKEAGRHVHNSYLELFGDLGLPGLILILLIIYRLAARSVTLIQRRGNYLQRNINAVFISVFAAGAVNAFFESWMFSVGNIIALMFWAPTAGIVAQWAWGPVPSEDRLEISVPTRELAHTLNQ